MGTEPSWFFFIPYLTYSIPVMLLEIVLLLTWLSLIFSGIGAGVHYCRDRGWYMRELGKAKNAENLMRDQRLQIAHTYAAPKTRSVFRRKKSK